MPTQSQAQGAALGNTVIPLDLHASGFVSNRRKSWKSGIVRPPFSLTYPGFSEISLLHSKQEVSAGSRTNGIALCGMSPIVIGTKTS